MSQTKAVLDKSSKTAFLRFGFSAICREVFAASLQLERAGIELVVHSLLGDQLLVVAALDDAAVVEHHDRVRVLDRRQPVSDDEHRPSLHQCVHALLDEILGASVDGRRRLVEDEHGRVCDRGTRDGQQLLLPLRQVGAVAGQHRVVAVRKTGDEVVRVGEFRRGDALVVGRVQLAVTDVVHDRAGEQVGVLQHHAKRPPEVGLADLVDVDAVIPDLAVRDVVEAVDEVGDRRLACAGRAYERDLLTGLRIERHVMKDDLVGHIAEVDVDQLDVAFELLIGDRAVRLVGVSPRPSAGTSGAFAQDLAVVVDDRVDQGDIALVRFGFLVEEAEDTLRARDSHDDGVDLHGHLPDVERELAAHVEECDDRADRQRVAQAGQRHVGHTFEHQQAADDRNEHEQDVTHVADGRHQDVAVLVRLVCVDEQFVVDLVEVSLCRLFVAEHLDDLLSGQHLFDIALGGADGVLLFDEILRALAADELGHKQHKRDAEQHDQGHVNARFEHRDHKRDDRDRREHRLRYALRYELAQRVDVVGVVAHDVAVRICVEIADRQLLHVVEHILADMFEEALRDDCHHAVVGERADQRKHIYARHDTDDRIQRALDRFKALFEPRRDDVVGQDLEEDGRADACDRGDRDAADDQDELPSVIVEHIFEQLAQRLHDAAALDLYLMPCHCRPPCAAQ